MSPHIKKSPFFNFPFEIRTVDTGPFPLSIFDSITTPVAKSEIEALIKSVLQKNEGMVNDYKKGKDKLFGFFVGQVMKESKGKANPQLVNQVLKDLLSK